MAFTDIHGHYLPAVDDGSHSLEETIGMIRAMAALGYDRIVATPHRREGDPLQDDLEMERLAEVRGALREAGLTVDLDIGAEYLLDGRFLGELERGRIRTLGAESQAFLIELHPSGQLPPYLEEFLFKARLKGLTPVLAHPERNDLLMRDWPRLEALAAQGVALLVSLGSLVGNQGRGVRKWSRRLIKEGLVRVVGSDIHSLNDIREEVEPALAWLRREVGEGRADLMMGSNVRRLQEGLLTLDDLAPVVG